MSLGAAAILISRAKSRRREWVDDELCHSAGAIRSAHRFFLPIGLDLQATFQHVQRTGRRFVPDRLSRPAGAGAPARSHQPRNATLGRLAGILLARELQGSLHHAFEVPLLNGQSPLH